MAKERQRKKTTRPQTRRRINQKAESTSSAELGLLGIDSEHPSKQMAGRVPVKVKFEGIEDGRLADIEASAQLLIGRILTPPEVDLSNTDVPEAVWGLRESLWPALSLPGQTLPNKVTLKLLPLSLDSAKWRARVAVWFW